MFMDFTVTYGINDALILMNLSPILFGVGEEVLCSQAVSILVQVEWSALSWPPTTAAQEMGWHSEDRPEM